MADKQYLLTEKGLRDLQKELEYSKTTRRKEVAEHLKLARSYGDLSENSEYDEAKDEQAKLEARIAELENILNNVKIIDEGDIGSEVVGIGATVVIYNKTMDMEITYSLVGSAEADPLNGKISDESPIGRALIGSKIGEVVTAMAPMGEIELEIKKIK
ncbi:MAG: transcription elongation factor GreA [Bacillota bacterium]|nr:transcription elongation factor GreA [Bacillota bacterium]